MFQAVRKSNQKEAVFMQQCVIEMKSVDETKISGENDKKRRRDISITINIYTELAESIKLQRYSL